MNYMLLVCNDGIEASEAEETLVAETITEHIARTADVALYGHPLQAPATAVTVRVRDGETLVTDGPFAEAKEHIAGFELLDCDTRERAIEAAASHPLAWFHKVEVRPVTEDDEWSSQVRERLAQEASAGTERYMLLICSDGTPTESKREAMERELPEWVERMTASGTRVVGGLLAERDDAATVRVRGPHTLVSDGPSVDADEFIAGFNVIECADLDEAVAVAAAHPVSRFHSIEVRPFTAAMCGEPSEPAESVVAGQASA